MEEKGSDVNLAIHLLKDVRNGLFDADAVISNYTNLVKLIRVVTAQRGKPVFIMCPGLWQVAPQLPNTLLGTAISKPAGW